MLELVVFDCDGVLVDSEVIVARLESDLLAAAGVTITPEEIMEDYVGLTEDEMQARLEVAHGVDLGAAFTAKREREVSALREHLPPVAGIAGVLDALSVPCCVASSGRPERIALSLQATGLDRYFGSRVFSASMVERGKPAPDLFLHAAAEMGADPARCLVVEDSRAGVQAAAAAGMDVVGFTGASHAGPGLASALRASGAGAVVATAAELSEVIRERAGLSR